MNFLLKIGFLLLALAFWMTLRKRLKKDSYQLETDIKKSPSIAIIIPARNESKVIGQLLTSIVNQTVSVLPSHVYIIVEQANDPTIFIAKKFHMNVFIRQNLSLKTKGYAIAELIDDLQQKKINYDLYFIFDADNVLSNNYIEEMLSSYQAGYAMAMGYRAIKNNSNVVAVSSWLTFLLINEYRNLKAIKNKENILFSGTGYYIHGRLISQWQTFPFHSLTEDYEISLYATKYALSTTYNKKAIYYDEQPENYTVSIHQRSRWIKGYFQNWLANIGPFLKASVKKKRNSRSLYHFGIGILPLVFLILGVLTIFLGIFGLNKFWLALLIFLGAFYLFGMFLTIKIMKNVQNELKITKGLYWQTVFYHPIFLLSYLQAFLVFLCKKNLGWSVIPHYYEKK